MEPYRGNDIIVWVLGGFEEVSASDGRNGSHETRIACGVELFPIVPVMDNARIVVQGANSGDLLLKSRDSGLKFIDVENVGRGWCG